jgi:DNA-binding LytR/AlgR family response regulator
MSTNQPKVLILEDDPMMRLDLEESLRFRGFQVTRAAANSEQAIASLKTDPPDIAILDIDLKDSLLDGIQTARIIKEHHPIPIIFLTAIVDAGVMQRAKEINPAYYLIKPSSPLQLDIAIDMALENYWKEKEAQVYHSLEAHSYRHQTVYPIKNALFVKNKGKYQRINVDQIYYVEASNSSIMIETEIGKFVISANLKNFQKQFTHPSLVKIHRSYIINMEKVNSFDESEVYLVNGSQRMKLPIGQSYKEDFERLVFKLRSGG